MIQNHQLIAPSRDVIAVVGMAGRFPGASTVVQFWHNLRDGVESIREFSSEELQTSGLGLDVLDDPTYVNIGAPLEDADCFDAAFFGYNPREAELMDPQQRLFLECAYAAIQDTGYDPARLQVPVAVFGGVARNTYFIRNAEVYRSLMDQGALYEALLGSEKDFTATRVSFKLNLKGPGINVQGACATSGIAVHLACQSLLAGETDMAIAGGARIRVPLHAGYLYVEGGIPSPDGHCRAFDAGANGCVFGSGVAMLSLKRLSDALADGDQIHALILSTAINNDGAAKVGFTAPSVEGQSAIIQEALALADVDSGTIDYVEAHGTGTTLGDPIEIAALTKAFLPSSSQRNHCAIGSVKTNIGHLDAGAGAAGLIKTILSLKHKQIPASLNFTRPNPQIDFDNSPFFVNDKLRDWDADETPRRAGVSSFGLGGTNFHAILEEAPSLQPSEPGRPWQLLPLSTRTSDALNRATSDLAEHMTQNPDQNLADAAYTLQLGRPSFEHRCFVVCSDVRCAADQLQQVRRSQSAKVAGVGTSPVVFMFPGQGAQYINMGRDLYQLEDVFRAEVDACIDTLKPMLGFDLREILYPQPSAEEQAAERLKQTSTTQSALFVIEYALARLWQSWGIEPEAMIGHSLGEYVAATVAGVFSVNDALELLVARGKLMQQQPAGSMLAVQLSEKEVQPYLSGQVSLAAFNAPSLGVVSGPTDEIEALERQLTDQGITARTLVTSHAFHSAMMESAIEPFLEAARGIEFSAPTVPFISSLTGTWITDQQATCAEYWGQQMRQPVYFSRGICELQTDPARVLLEVGPGKTLSMLTQQHCGNDARTTVVASLRHPRETDPDLACLMTALGQLWAAGVEIDWERLYVGQRRRRVSLPTYPFERKRFWLTSKTDSDDSAALSAPLVAGEAVTSSVSMVPSEELPSSTQNALPTAAVSQPVHRKEVVVGEICKILHELSGVDLDQIDQKATFLAMGFDSLFLTQANTAFQRKFKVKITFRQLFADAPTPEALAEYIDQQLPTDDFVPPPPQTAEVPALPSSPQLARTPPTARLPAIPIAGDAADPLTSRGNDEGSIQDVIRQQMEMMHRQLDLLGAAGMSDNEAVGLRRLRAAQQQTLRWLVAPADDADTAGRLGISESNSVDESSFGPFRPVSRHAPRELTTRQQEFLTAFTTRFNRKTKSSKRHAQQNRQHLADPRTVAGFRLHWKECVYPIVAQRSAGAYIWDLDGNKYVDLAMGFGVHMLGHSPPFITKEIQRQLKQGYAIGPQTTLAGEVAGLLCEMTGMQRACFCNTGSEAVLAAMRIARTVTGRTKIVTFSGDYHGIFDEVLGRNVIVGGQRRSLPVAPGILPEMLEHLILLDYDDFASLYEIEAQADDIAAVIVEPVRTRNPDLQPRDFLHALRKLTAREEIALIFDEMATGFRIHPGGAQAWFDVHANIATYGKVVGGGMPIGVVAGDSLYMDALDGGMWQFGDDSVPEAGVTWFAGTFARHPMALAAARATLRHMKESGPGLQEELNARTARFARELNEYFASVQTPLRIQYFSSFFLITFEDCEEFSSLFYCCLREKGIHITENRAAFLSTAHTEKDMRFLVQAFKSSVAELMESGFLVPLTSSAASAQGDAAATHSTTEKTVTSAGHTRVPLTEGQSEIWLAASAGDDVNCSFNLSFTLRLSGELAVNRLSTAVQMLVDRHEALRTVFDKDGEFQEVRRSLEVELVQHNLAGITPRERDSQLAQLREEAVTTPFDLVHGPLFRLCLICLAPQEHLLFLTMHHIVCDGYSSGILLRHVSEIYSALSQNRSPSLPEPASFVENVLRQRQDPDAKQAESYWIDRFRNPPSVIDLPTDQPRPPVKTFHASRLQRVLDPELSKAISRDAAEQECTVFALIFAAFTAFLERLTRQDDVVVGITAARQAAYGEPELVGHFVNLLPVRVAVNRQRSFLDHLDVTKRRLLDAFDHQAYTFGTLVKRLRLPRDPSRLPIVSVVFNMDAESAPLAFGDLRAEPGSNPRRFENFDWFFNVLPRKDGMLLECTYNSDLFEEVTMQRRLHEFETLISGIVADPQMSLCELPLVPDSERQKLAFDWNQTQHDYPSDRCIHRLFEEQAQRTPDKVAVLCEGRKLTYAQLDRKANSLAHQLARRGIGPDVLVGICSHRTTEMMVGILGILKAGGAYVPIDPSYPKDRIQFILDNSRSRVLVTETSLLDTLPIGNREVLVLDEINHAATNHDVPAVDTNTNHDHLAYVIYTSGSTGRPKGVQITHRALVNFLSSMQREPGMTSEDTLFAVTTLSFDIAGMELFLPLIVGGCVEIASGEVVADVMKMMDVLEQSDANIMQATPATWRMLIEAGWRGKKDLKVLSGGEAMPRDIIAPLVASCSELWNMYGPTETTIWSSVMRFDRSNGVISIGRPIDNTQMYVLDEILNLVPIGVPGELYIGGDGLARGYLDRPELTKERFIPDPYGENGKKIYKTGDLARFLTDGQIECLGRIDHQVKIRGHRIELGEIESVLSMHPGVQEAVAVAREDIPGDQRLAAYFTASQQNSLPESAELRTYLRSKLPNYMVPQYFVLMPSIPLTPNGKVDRQALPDPQATRRASLAQADTPTVIARRQPGSSPRDALEMQLRNTWEALLHVKPIGIHDDFFDLGGHSLLAVRLMVQIERIHGKRLPLATLLNARTVAQLADILRAENWEPRWNCLVPMRAGGEKPSLFLMHSHGGNVLEYDGLVARLGDDLPVYALQARGLDGKIDLNPSIEDMAACYVDEIKSFQPEGPYNLGGFCFGGTVALEVARQLQSGGEDVSQVVLIQCQAEGYPRYRPGVTLIHRAGYRMLKRIHLERSNLASLKTKAKLVYICERIKRLVDIIRVRTAIAVNPLLHKVGVNTSKPSMAYVLETLSIAHQKAIDKYKQRPYKGKVILLRAEKQLGGVQPDETLGWERFLNGQLEVHEVPGHQQNMLKEPNVTSLARRLRSCLDQDAATNTNLRMGQTGPRQQTVEAVDDWQA